MPFSQTPQKVLTALQRRLAAAGVRDQRGDPLGRPGDGDRPRAPARVVVGRVGDPHPLFSTDLAQALETPQRLLRGLVAIGLLLQASRVLLALREDWWDALSALRRRAARSVIELHAFAARVPLDDDDLLCDLLERRPAAATDGATAFALTATALNDATRVAVYDAATLCDVGAAVDGEPPPRRAVSVVGACARPRVLRVPLGTTLFDLGRACGCDDFGWLAFHNGVLSGGEPLPADAPVDLDTRGLLLLPVRHPLVVARTTPIEDLARRAAAACIDCRICTEVCPVHLNGEHLQPHRLVRAAARSVLDPRQVTDDDDTALVAALECRDCRVCDLACPARLDPGRVVGAIRQRLRQAGASLTPPIDDAGDRGAERTLDHRRRTRRTRDLQPLTEREGRRLSLARATEQLGLHIFEIAAPRPRHHLPTRLALSIVPRTGKPRHPVVQPGDHVARGDLLATDDDGLALLSPIVGQVAAVNADSGIVLQVA